MQAGRVGRAHGLDGSFSVTQPLPALLVLGHAVEVAGLARTIERRSGTDAKPILRITGCTTREQAEVLRGSPLLIEQAALPPLGQDEFWAHELEGCRVVDGERDVGVVARLVSLPSCEALEVGERLIPLVHDAVRSVDIEARRVDVDLGFLGER